MRILSGTPRPLMPWMKRQGRRSWILGAAIGLGLGVLLVVRAGSIARDPTVEPRLVGALAVTDATGLTFSLTLDDGSRQLITLLGVRIMPSHRDAAVERIGELLDGGQPVMLTFDPTLRQTPDAAGRWRAYVYLSDARMLNEVLLSEGLAKADRDSPAADHVAARSLGQIEALARRRGLGLWAR